MRRSWLPEEYIGAALIPSPASKSRLRTMASNRSQSPRGKLARRRKINPQPKLDELEEQVFYLSLADSDEENLGGSRVTQRKKKTVTEENPNETTFDSHPIQTRQKENLEFKTCQEDSFHPVMESTRMSHILTDANRGNLIPPGASSVSSIQKKESRARISISSDTSCESVNPNRYCEVFPIKEGLSPRFSRSKNLKSPVIILETSSSEEEEEELIPGSPLHRTAIKLKTPAKRTISLSSSSSSEAEEIQPQALFPEISELESEPVEVNSFAPGLSRLHELESQKHGRVDEWVLQNTKNFRRTSSSSTLATFREFVENDDEESTSVQMKPGRKSTQCGENDDDPGRTVECSTDEDEADKRLEEMFKTTRTQLNKTRRKKEASVESLDNFIVPDEGVSSTEDDYVQPPSDLTDVSVAEQVLWRQPVLIPDSPEPSPVFATPRNVKKGSTTSSSVATSSTRSKRLGSVAKKTLLDEVSSTNFTSMRDCKYFLGALDEDADNFRLEMVQLAEKCKANFKHVREPLTRLLFNIFNLHCFEQKLPDTTEIIWNARMVKTAGFCVYKIKRFMPDANGHCKPSDRFVKIELSGKVLDSADRLRDTLAHEMCHAASWIISECNGGHGPVWKRWTKRVAIVFSNIPLITTKHTYEIKTKFTYRCISCGYSFGRHSKSLDLERKRCGHCHGRFELLVNGKPTAASVASASSAPSHLTKFAAFVQENFRSVKATQGAGKSHAEVMGILSARFAALKLISKN